jgi:hypothetical protein
MATFVSPLINWTTQLLSSLTTVLAAFTAITVVGFAFLGRGRLKFGQFTLEFPKPRIPELDEERLIEGNRDLDPAERQYLLLKAYHEQSLGQSRASMWFSLIFAAVGFCVIILAVFVPSGSSNSPFGAERLIKLVSGTVIDAVAGLFFVQSNKARELMSTFFDKLRTDRKLDESLTLAHEVPDAVLKSRLQLVLSLNFADVKVADPTLLAILGIPADHAHAIEDAQKLGAHLAENNPSSATKDHSVVGQNGPVAVA